MQTIHRKQEMVMVPQTLGPDTVVRVVILQVSDPTTYLEIPLLVLVLRRCAEGLMVSRGTCDSVVLQMRLFLQDELSCILNGL